MKQTELVLHTNKRRHLWRLHLLLLGFAQRKNSSNRSRVLFRHAPVDRAHRAYRQSASWDRADATDKDRSDLSLIDADSPQSLLEYISVTRLAGLSPFPFRTSSLE